MMPPMVWPEPPRNFEVEWTTMSAPYSIGRIRAGEARVLSTTSGRLWRRATSAIPTRSITVAQGLTIDSQTMARVSGVICGLEIGRRQALGELRLEVVAPVEAAHQAERAAEQARRGDVGVAALHQRHQDEEHGRLARGHRHRRLGALQGRDAALQRRHGRVRAARVGEAGAAHREDVGRLLGGIEHEAVREVDRLDPRTGRGIGGGAGMDRLRREAVGTGLGGHGASVSRKAKGSGGAPGEGPQGPHQGGRARRASE